MAKFKNGLVQKTIVIHEDQFNEVENLARSNRQQKNELNSISKIIRAAINEFLDKQKPPN